MIAQPVLTFALPGWVIRITWVPVDALDNQIAVRRWRRWLFEKIANNLRVGTVG